MHTALPETVFRQESRSNRRKTIPTTTNPSPPHCHVMSATLSRILVVANRGEPAPRKTFAGSTPIAGNTTVAGKFFWHRKKGSSTSSKVVTYTYDTLFLLSTLLLVFVCEERTMAWQPWRLPPPLLPPSGHCSGHLVAVVV